MADASRALQSRRLLLSLQQENKDAVVRLAQSKEQSQRTLQEITSIESRLAALNQELRVKRGILEAANKEITEVAIKIKFNEEKKLSLCIRCLDKKLLKLVLSFIGKNGSGAYATCKYWKALFNEIESGK